MKKQKIIAKRYFSTFGFDYYRTESGHTFSQYKGQGKYVHYFGNVKEKGHEGTHILLTDEQKQELFNRVEFEN